MKNALIILPWLLGIVTSQSIAQHNPSPTGKDKMAIFKPWIGNWQGEGSMRMGPGEAKKSTVNEKIEYRLDERLLVMEGIGKAYDDSTKSETVVHHAFGVLSYDETTSGYKFKTYLKDGRNTEAWFNVLSDSQYQWGFDVPQGKIRYSIIIDPSRGTWNETGEFSPDGSTWHKFFEMNLNRVNNDR